MPAPDWADGMAASLPAGLHELVRTAQPQVLAALVHLVDLSDVDASVVRRLAAGEVLLLVYLCCKRLAEM